MSGPARGNLPDLGYGFCFSTGSFEEHPWFGHSGGTLGVNSEVVAFPRYDAVVVVVGAVLANRDPPMAAELLRIELTDLSGPATALSPQHSVPATASPVRAA